MSDSSVRSGPPPARPAGDDAAKTAAYRPLSLLALCGVGVSGLFAAVVILGGLVAFFRGDPLLLTGWLAVFSAGFPLAGAAVSYVALVRIQRSEGTLAGEKLARWGLVLSILVGLSYWAYVGATYVAIGQDAGRFAEKFLTELKDENRLLYAFRLTLPPEQRPPEDNATLRDQIEARFNSPGAMGSQAPLTTFTQAEYVRLIGQGGAATQFEALGVEDWKYIGGGYQVGLLYRITTPYMSFPILITVEGKDSQRAEGRREWHVVWDKTTLRDMPPPSMTDEARRLLPLAMMSREMGVKEWLALMRDGKTEEVFLKTLPVPERAPTQRAAHQRRLGLSLMNGFGLGATPVVVASRALLAADADLGFAIVEPRFHDFQNGSLVRAEPPVFWAPDAIKEEVVRLFREPFRASLHDLPVLMTPEMRVRVLRHRVEGGRFIVEHDFSGRLPAANPRYAVEGRIVVDCDAAEAANGMVKDWRIRSVELIAGRSLPPTPTGPADRRMPTGM